MLDQTPTFRVVRDQVHLVEFGDNLRKHVDICLDVVEKLVFLVEPVDVVDLIAFGEIKRFKFVLIFLESSIDDFIIFLINLLNEPTIENVLFPGGDEAKSIFIKLFEAADGLFERTEGTLEALHN